MKILKKEPGNGYYAKEIPNTLEARWAVIFDNLGIKYDYEVEGYDIGYGISYLPDFILYGGGERCPKKLFVEVKGEMTFNDAAKIKLFSNAYPLYIVGPIPNDIHDIAGGIYTETGCSYYNFETVDGDNFGAGLGAQKGGGWGLFGDDGSYWKYMDIQKTQNAYAIGRQARFEHGETPRPPWEV